MLQQLRARCASRAWIYHSPANGTGLLTGDRRHEQQASAARAAGAAPAVLPKLSGSSSGFVFEHRLDLIAKLRTIRMPMRRNSMLHRGIEHFFFRAGHFQRAIFLARVISAINRFSLTCHCDLQFDQLFFNSAKSLSTCSLWSAGFTPV